MTPATARQLASELTQHDAFAAHIDVELGIDPDDLSAHYNLMRCLRRLRRIPEARREETIYELLREDDRAKAIGLAYLRRHAAEDQEALTIHEHVVRPPSERVRPSARGKG